MDRLIEDEPNRKLLIRFIEQQHFPFVVTITKGRKRSIEQNKLQRLWMKEIAEQMYEGTRYTAEQWRGYCKLHFGIPIRREESDVFRAMYDRVLKPLNYDERLLLMQEPLDLPVTRDMTTKQKTDYLDAILRFAAEEGLVLTLPNEPARAA